MTAINPIVFLSCVMFAHGQLAAMFGNGNQSDPSCSTWSQWSNCLWLKGQTRARNGTVTVQNPWNQPFFRQLSRACQAHRFYSYFEDTYGSAIESAFAYFRQVTEDNEPCGFCSYQQSCGFNCARPVKYNVSERLCGHQNHACTLNNANANALERNCQIWPSDRVNLTGVEPQYQTILRNMKLTNCIPGYSSSGQRTCRCCCLPYAPDPVTFECKILPGSNNPFGR